MRKLGILIRGLSILVVFTIALSIVPGNVEAQLEKEWSKTYRGENDDWVGSVVRASDGGYVMAGFTRSSGVGRGDFWLVKTDSQGNREWSKTYGGENYDEGNSIVQASDGGYVIAGETTSYGAGASDFWLVKTDSQGNREWSKTYGDENNDWGKSIVRASDGGYVIAGMTVAGNLLHGEWHTRLVKTDSQGNAEWSETYRGKNDKAAYSVVRASDGGYVIAGRTVSFGAGGDDFWLMRVDSQGNKEWSKTYGGENDDRAGSVVRASDGGYVMAGFTRSYGAGASDFWLVKTDSQGNREWGKTYGGENADWTGSVVKASDGGYVIAGTTGSRLPRGGDVRLIKFVETGGEKNGLSLTWIKVAVGIIIAAVVVFLAVRKI